MSAKERKTKNAASRCAQDPAEAFTRLAFATYFVAFGVELLDGLLELALIPSDQRLTAGLVTTGYLLLHAVPLYGLKFRAAWAWVLAELLALFTIALYSATLIAPYVLPQLYIGDHRIDQPPLQQALGWLLVAIYLVFVVASCKAFLLRRVASK